jgi:hypothetical protein
MAQNAQRLVLLQLDRITYILRAGGKLKNTTRLSAGIFVANGPDYIHSNTHENREDG